MYSRWSSIIFRHHSHRKPHKDIEWVAFIIIRIHQHFKVNFTIRSWRINHWMIGYYILCAGCFARQNIVNNWIVESYPPHQIGFYPNKSVRSLDSKAQNRRSSPSAVLRSLLWALGSHICQLRCLSRWQQCQLFDVGFQLGILSVILYSL